MKKGGTLQRILTALVILPLSLVLIWVPELRLGFVLLIGLFVAVGLLEYYRLVLSGDAWRPGLFLGTIVAASGGSGRAEVVNALLLATIIIVCQVRMVRPDRDIYALTAAAFGVIYVGWTSAHLLLLHSAPELGPGLVMLLFVAVVLTHSGAYFIGKNFGRHKMAPAVSPNKSWEGAVGGFLCAALGTAGVVWLAVRFEWAAFPPWSLWWAALVGGLLSVAAQTGDLVESGLKRTAGVKDSGTFFPGHGGVLDRCDGFLFAAPVLYYIVRVFP